MKTTLLFITFLGFLLLSCNQTDRAVIVKSKVTPESQTATTNSKSRRQLLVDELMQLQVVLASNNQEKIADIFPFPIANETIGIYMDDKLFNEQLEKNGNKVTRSMFINSYRDISENLQIDQLNQLFTKLTIADLLKKDALEHEATIKTEPCYQYYHLKIEGDLVTLTVGTNSNKNYRSISLPEDEIPENDSSICEHVLWWKFTFDGNQLKLKEISGAG